MLSKRRDADLRNMADKEEQAKWVAYRDATERDKKPVLFADLETYSEVPINHGTHAYAENAEIMVITYAIGDGPVRVVDCANGDDLPAELARAFADNNVITVWHNGSGFDRHLIKRAWGWALPIHRVHDTMVRAMTHGMPGALAVLCDILKVDADKVKDKRGKELINLFCKPRPKTHKIRRATKATHPEEWAQFLDYAASDILAMREVYKKLPKWNYQGAEFDLYCLDAKINDRGVRVDLDLARAAIIAVDKAKDKVSAKVSKITDGKVERVTQRDRLIKFVAEEHGVYLKDFKAATLERAMADPGMPRAVREILALRLEGSKASVSKYKKLINAAGSGERLRGLLQFCGAPRTGRWSGRLFQPQNLMRPTMPQDEIEKGIEAMKANVADLLFPNVIDLAANAMRGVIISDEGKKLYISDLANIEGRAGAWLAGEEWKLEAFRAYDAGTGPDLYTVAYAKAFDIEAGDVDKPQRQIGKVMELMLQYEGGVGAFITGALAYRIDLFELAEIAWPLIAPWAQREALKAWDWAVRAKKTGGLPKKVYVACDGLKRLWRKEHPAIASYWKELRDAYIAAIQQPGKTIHCRKVSFRRDGAWLRVRLPSGRYLCYSAPKVVAGSIQYKGLRQNSRKWDVVYTYGGKLFENICQAVARDFMAANEQPIEDAGYDILLTVHDELITQADDAPELFSEEDLSMRLARNPEWAMDMPLAAGGFEAYRYRKD